jgi:hypothetical protein
MTPMTALRVALAASSCVIILTHIATRAEADITRHCRAHYSVDLPGPGATAFPIPDFTASGSCGSTVPNRCRERASGRAHTCMQKHWDTRWNFVRPLECTPAHGVTGYNFTDVKRMIEMAACCTLGSPLRNTSGTVQVSRLTYGDKGCGDGKISFGEVPPSTANPAGQYDVKIVTLSDYEVNCPVLRQQLCP